ncbi:MAG: acyl-ACP--UDP-N-acetylglucosamine O-acyltransferase [Alphaproteobacteria bacterium]|nr:acyl-ACP--UDP-N-acetylglucosamine O-acyltransferase [Alphaproteobacteria bacterium]
MSPLIHPTAIIDKKAEIGNNVQIGAYSVIGADVVLHDNVCLQSHIVVEGPTSIGKGTQIYPFCVIGTPAQHTKYKGEPATLEIGANNIIREKVSIHRGTEIGGMSTVIGNNNFILADCHIAHDCSVGNNNVFANGVALGGHVIVGNHCFMGGFSAVQQFVRIGDIVMIGAKSLVTQDIIPFSIATGIPCDLRGVNIIGLKRQNYTPAQITNTRNIFKNLFEGEGQFSSRLESACSRFGSDLLGGKIFDFIQSKNHRPICMPINVNFSDTEE